MVVECSVSEEACKGVDFECFQTPSKDAFEINGQIYLHMCRFC